MKNPVPQFVALVAITIDGKIAQNSHHFSDWTSPEDKEFLRDELAKCDAVVVGRNTFETAKDRLLKRNSIVFSSTTKEPIEQFPHVWFIDPAQTDLVEFARARKFNKIAVLGGAGVYAWFTEHNLINDWHITIEPLIFGTGIPLLKELPYQQRQYILIGHKLLNKRGSLLLHYRKA